MLSKAEIQADLSGKVVKLNLPAFMNDSFEVSEVTFTSG